MYRFLILRFYKKKPFQRRLSTDLPNNNIFSAFCMVLLFIILGISGCKDKIKSGEIETKREKIKDVTVTALAPTTIDDVFELTGSVKARLSANISTKVIGEVTDVYVKEGDVVKAGQILLKIDDSDINERIKAADKGMESAKHNRDLSRKTYQRYKALADEKAVSGHELDQIETQMRVSEAEYERAKALLNEALTYLKYTKITAPYNGIITAKHIDKGNMAVQGMPLFSIESNEKYYIEVSADESMLGVIKTGLPVRVFFDSLNNEFREMRAKVTEVIPSVDTKTRTFTVKIDLPMHNIRSGMFARVGFLTGKKESILINKDWVVKKGQLTGVYTVDDKGIINYRLIKLGKTFGDRIEVISGLNQKDKIISNGIEKAFEGGIIEVAQR